MTEAAGRALGDLDAAEAAIMPQVLLLCYCLLTHVCTEMAVVPSDRREFGSYPRQGPQGVGSLAGGA